MGDGADMALENAFDDIEQLEAMQLRRATKEELHEAGHCDDMGVMYPVAPFPIVAFSGRMQNMLQITYKTCKACGMQGLSWIKTDAGWRLRDQSGTIHSCKEYKL